MSGPDFVAQVSAAAKPQPGSVTSFCPSIWLLHSNHCISEGLLVLRALLQGSEP